MDKWDGVDMSQYMVLYPLYLALLLLSIVVSVTIVVVEWMVAVVSPSGVVAPPKSIRVGVKRRTWLFPVSEMADGYVPLEILPYRYDSQTFDA